MQYDKIEFIHKKFKYLFPINTKIYMNGKKLNCYIDNELIKKPSEYITVDFSKTKNKIGFVITSVGSNIHSEYEYITKYLKKNKSFNYKEFDYATSYELILCTFFKSKNINIDENILKSINEAMPYILNIFSRPLIHLKSSSVVNRIDTVTRINHASIRHLGMHPENIREIKNSNIKPSKLLTRIYVDDYGIYENIVFKNLVDIISLFLEKRIFDLKEVISTFKESIQLEEVTGFNHPKYYLSIGKLYLGFSSKEDHKKANSILDNTESLFRVIQKNKFKEVYSKNINKKKIIGSINKTNILMFHKDYKHIYNLYDKLEKMQFDSNDGEYKLQHKSQIDYTNYIMMIVLFSITNFNFTSEINESIYKDENINTSFTFLDWNLSIKTIFIDFLDFKIIELVFTKKSKINKIALIPISYYLSFNKKNTYENIIGHFINNDLIYDKYAFFEPFSFEFGNLYGYNFNYKNNLYSILPISITDVNSFRRIQKLIFESLVKTNIFNYCAFCGSKMKKDNGIYFCSKCQTVVEKIKCKCLKTYYATTIAYNKKSIANSNLSFLYKQDKLYDFRNIVSIIDDEYVCPYCTQTTKKGKVNLNVSKN